MKRQSGINPRHRDIKSTFSIQLDQHFKRPGPNLFPTGVIPRFVHHRWFPSTSLLRKEAQCNSKHSSVRHDRKLHALKHVLPIVPEPDHSPWLLRFPMARLIIALNAMENSAEKIKRYLAYLEKETSE